MPVVYDSETWDDAATPQRSQRWLVLLVVLGVAVAIGVGLSIWRRTPAFEDVTAQSGRLMLKADDRVHQTVIDRQAGPEVWYQVLLQNAPNGAVLPLTCEWIDPAGKVYHRNRYETKPITHGDWPTHARCRIQPDAPIGPWRVQLSLQGRLLHQQSFEVRDRAAKKE